MPFATLSPTDIEDTQITLANGNLTAQYSASGTRDALVMGNQLLPAGTKIYFEFTYTTKVGTAGLVSVGVGERHMDFSSVIGTSQDFPCWGIDLSGDKRSYLVNDVDIRSPDMAQGDTWRVAVDVDGGKIWFGDAVGGTWFEGDPAAGTGASFTDLASAIELIPMVSFTNTADGNHITFNFGASAFIGTVPSGFEALNFSPVNYGNTNALDEATFGRVTHIAVGGNWFTYNLSAAGTSMGRAASPIPNTGKFYWEVVWHGVNAGQVDVGISDPDQSNTAALNTGSGGDTWGMDDTKRTFDNGAIGTDFPGSFAAGDVMRFAVDMDLGHFWVGDAIADTWFEGDPELGTGASYTNLGINTADLYPALSFSSTATSSRLLFNFGQYPYHGTVPTGFASLPATAAGDGIVTVPISIAAAGRVRKIHGDGRVSVKPSVFATGELRKKATGSVTVPFQIRATGRLPLLRAGGLVNLAPRITATGTVHGIHGDGVITVRLNINAGQDPPSADEASARVVYELTLIDTSGELPDVKLKMSTFQLRLRAGITESFASATVPNVAVNIDAITARQATGELLIERVRESVTATERVEIARLSIDQVLTQRGGRSSSVTLNGHGAIAANPTPTLWTVSKAIVVASDSGSSRVRMRLPANSNFKLGDSVQFQDTAFEIGEIVWVVNASQATVELVSA